MEHLLETIQSQAAEHGLSAEQRGNSGHFQLKGGVVLVNYYPTTGTIYTDGAIRIDRGDLKRAIAIALGNEDVLVGYGKHFRKPLSKVPPDYLHWMVSREAPLFPLAARLIAASRVKSAPCEPLPQPVSALQPPNVAPPAPKANRTGLKLTRHAIDRVSQRALSIWRQTRRSEDEGLATWLVRMARESRVRGQQRGETCWAYKGLIFAFKEDHILATVMWDDGDPALALSKAILEMSAESVAVAMLTGTEGDGI